ncbi:MAG: NAD-dependent epimerase/dehydratase [Candidatus Levybacteria bacterium]|nr:NAD-dependent epimerase/dehydratase [Candidatus Levybacteria bacterium]
MKKILVTGGAGYIGSVLTADLLDKGFKVRVFDRFMFGGESLLSFVNNKNLEILKGDVRDSDRLKIAVNGVDSIIHLAALVGEPACRENPKVTKEINHKAAGELASLARENGVERFIFVSTCSNYGISKANEKATEESELNPLSLYAETKIEAEKFILGLTSDNFHPTVLRLATIFGLSPRMRFNLMVNEVARETAVSGKFSIYNKNAWRPFLHVQDVSNAFLTVLQSSNNQISGKIFNVVGENIQKAYLIELAKKFNPQFEIEVNESGKDDKRDYRVSANKIMDKLGWKPRITVKDGFLEIFNAVRNGLFLDPYEFRYNAWFDNKVFKR